MALEFPDINYKYWLSDWEKSIGELGVYKNKNLSRYIQFDGDINSCTEEILNLTALSKPSKETVLRVVDLIYSWGGRSGRMFYAKSKGRIPREELEHDPAIFENYLKGVNTAKEGKTESIKLFRTIHGMGSSYASKHSYFWSLHSENPLIIVDSKIAGALGSRTIQSLEQQSSYEETVQAFTEFSKLKFHSKEPHKVERALFAFHNYYFLNNNTNWKNTSPSHDYSVAKRLAVQLFEH